MYKYQLTNSRLLIVNLFILLVFSSCTFIKPVQITKIKSVQIEKLSVSSAKLNLEIQIENPNPVKITVTDIMLKVKAENELLGTINETDNIIIAPKSHETIKVKLNVSFSNVISKAFKIVKILSGSDAEISLNGTIQTKAFFIKRTIDINEEDVVSLFKD